MGFFCSINNGVSVPINHRKVWVWVKDVPTLISFDISHPHLIFISRFHVVLLSDIPRVLGQTDATTNKILETIMHPLKGLGT